MAKKLDQEKGLAISGFMIALISGIQNPKDFKAKFDALANAIYTLGVKVNPLIATSIWLASKLLTKKTGDALAKFIDALIKPLSEYKPKTLEAASKVIESIGKMLLMISAAIGIITVLVMMDLKSTLIGAGIVVAIIRVLIFLVAKCTDDKGELTAGVKGLKKISQALLLITVSIAILTYLVS